MRRHIIKTAVVFVLLNCIVSSCNKDTQPDIPVRAKILHDLVSKIEAHQYGEVHSVVIAENDSIIFEKYFSNYSRDNKNALYSVTKSFTSALIGICLAEGYIDSIGMKVLDFFPEYDGSIENPDPLKSQITIRDLLTMTAGFTWDEWTTSYNDPDNDVVKLIQSTDWTKYVLDKPMSHVPGDFITYNSGVSHLLSAIITKATGESASDFASDHLFTPIDITDWTWMDRPDGTSIGGWGLSLRSVDMIRFGELYLHKGLWKSVQVIPESWINESTAAHYKMNYWCDYGYQWWLYGSQMSSMKANGIFLASGRGEQYIWVIPKYNAVAVCTGWNDGQSLLEHALWEYILPALDN